MSRILRVFARVFFGCFVLELALFGINAVSRTQNPIAFFPLVPIIWIALAIGGVHSAGFLSIVFAFVITTFVYGVIGTGIWLIVSKATRNNKP